MPPQPLPHPAQTGFANSSAYDTHRPSFPPTSVQTLLSRLRVAGVARARLVDLGAGTGKFTELLVAREEGFRVTAVEPHAGMREVLVGKEGLEGVVVLDGVAGGMGVEGGSVDAVVAAQTSIVFNVASVFTAAVVVESNPSGKIPPL
ncbi:hypothetical protein LTR50_005579 [Elasticomyces elasticus]|nr:hypothetical protein LTR50_005579 [Elasticomyces elasticus]